MSFYNIEISDAKEAIEKFPEVVNEFFKSILANSNLLIKQHEDKYSKAGWLPPYTKLKLNDLSLDYVSGFLSNKGQCFEVYSYIKHKGSAEFQIVMECHINKNNNVVVDSFGLENIYEK